MSQAPTSALITNTTITIIITTRQEPAFQRVDRQALTQFGVDEFVGFLNVSLHDTPALSLEDTSLKKVRIKRNKQTDRHILSYIDRRTDIKPRLDGRVGSKDKT